MIAINLQRANIYLNNARLALQSGDRLLAKKKARQAVFFNQKLVQAWLILAFLSTPEKSIICFKKALEYEPKNEKAIKGLKWASRRLRIRYRKNRVEKQAAKTSASISIHWPLTLLLSLITIGLVFLLGIGIPILNAQASIQERKRPEDALFKPTLTPTITPTATQTPTPTLTPTPLPTATPDTAFSSYRYHPWDIPEEVAVGNDFWIEINLSNQMLYAYRGGQIISGFLVSTGTSKYATVTGTYKIYAKYTAYTMIGPEYNLPDVPYSMFFYKGYAIHGTYWHDNFGTPMSHGCVNMLTNDAALLYQVAPVGTYVFVHN